MKHPPDRTETARHARLFELIRQDNVINGTTPKAPRKSAPDLVEMQRFLKRAEQSFHPDRDE